MKEKKLYAVREYKDVLFRKIFNDTKELLALYNALNHTQYDNPNDLEIVTLEKVFFLKLKNDVAFIINTNELCLFEHASTVCLNYPLRGFLYLAKEYEVILEKRGERIHKRTQIKIPTPRYIVFYNGLEERPEREILKLSDAFENKKTKGCLEMTAEVININYDKNKDLLKTCKTLGDYAILVEKAREFCRETKDLSEGIIKAIDFCIAENHLREFLIKCKAEVRAMLLSQGTLEEYVDDMKREQADTIDKLQTENKKLYERITQLEEELQKTKTH